ncbi:MAG: SymE family type I addiction module toxin [Bacillota bacterium]
MKDRRLTIGYTYAGSRKVPALRLSGLWLDNLGFQSNQKVIVKQLPGLTTIQLIEEGRTCE